MILLKVGFLAALGCSVVMIVFTCYILLVCNKIHFLNNCIVFIFTRVVWSAEWFRNFAKYNSFSVTLYWGYPGALFTKWTDVLSQDFVKRRSREIGLYRSKIWQAHRSKIWQTPHRCCWGAREISERLEISKPESAYPNRMPIDNINTNGSK